MASTKTSYLSPGLYSIETDLSRLPAAAAQIGGAFIGPTEKGPAFVATQISTFNDFRTRYGGLNTQMYVPYAVQSYLQYAPVASIVRVLGKGNPANGYNVDLGRAFVLGFANSSVNVSGLTGSNYTSGISGVHTVAVLRTRQSGGIDVITDISYTGTAESFNLAVGGTTYNNLSLDRTQRNYIKNILGTDPTTVYFGDSATGIYVDTVLDYQLGSYTGSFIGSAYGSLNNASSASTTGIRYITGYTTGTTPLIVSQPYYNGSTVNVYNLFQLTSRTDGEASNFDIKVSIVDIDVTTSDPKIAPQFTIQIRDFNDTDSQPVILETFRCDLNPDSPFFISSVIGDRYPTVAITTPGGVPETIMNGQYPNKSAFVRVILYPGYNFDSRPAGFLGPDTIQPNATYSGNLPQDIPLNTNHLNSQGFKSNKVYLGFLYDGTNAIGFEDRLQGTFSAVNSGEPSMGFMVLASTAESAFWVPSASSISASLSSNYSIVDVTVTGSSTIIQNGYYFTVPLFGGFDGIPPSHTVDKAINDGTLSAEMQSALNVVANPDEIDINLLVIPGVHSGASVYNGQITSNAIELCEDRGDCFYIADIGTTLSPAATNITTDAMTTSVADAVNSVLGYDTNYAAVYYPWLRIYDPDNNVMVQVPPSVQMAGVYAYTDSVAQPWYAPAGFNRGTLGNVLEAYRRLTQTDRDTLYTGRINPIATFVGQGNVVMGQKTLQVIDSALNRVNVRRLLLYIKKVVAGIANLSLFEFNNAAGRQKLVDAITPVFDRIKVQNGLENFQIVIDSSNNTPESIDRNELHGTILLQPTKAIEFLILNYSITNSGAVFSEVLSNLNR